MKRVGLFIPCYIDVFYPNAALSTLKILKDLGYEVDYPLNQSCCGQPFLNSGVFSEAKGLAEKFIEIFKDFDYVIAPSASCVATVRYRYRELLKPSKELEKIIANTYEICEFLHDVVKLKELRVSFPHRVGFHQSCHGLRELELGVGSELVKPQYSKVKYLLNLVKDIEIVDLKRPDECCGFGGTFSINEPEISIAMGRDRIEDHKKAGAEYIVGYDMSCLMHMEAIAKRENEDIKFLHVVEILAGADDES
ncbi:MAG: (Fe-S)-binding protein [Epsilonproteobacteria bacterium]|nr:(Fe-S)-binding protein [Campylobacterota bacterium]